MDFELAEDVRAKIQMWALVCQCDPNNILRILLDLPEKPEPKRKPVELNPDDVEKAIARIKAAIALERSAGTA
jgi:hypothetical protein